jgi:integrase
MYNYVVGRKRKHEKNLPRHLRLKKGWYYFVADIKGLTKWFPLKTQAEDEALKRWAEVEASLRAQAFDLSKIEADTSTRISLGDLMKRYFAEVVVHLAASTQTNYKRMAEGIKAHFGEKRPIHNISRQEVIRWHDSLRGTPYEANRRLALLKILLGKARDWGFASANEAEQIQNFKEKKYKLKLTQEVLFDQIYPVASHMMKRAIMLGFHFAQHEHEVKRLEWKNFDFKRNVVEFVRRKTEETIVINYGPNTTIVDYLEHIRTERRELSPWLICHSSPTGWVPYGHFRSMWKSALDKAGFLDQDGVPVFKFKEIRHLSNTLMKDGGVTADKRRAMTGHVSNQANEIYTHPTGADTLDASKALSAYRPKKF